MTNKQANYVKGIIKEEYAKLSEDIKTLRTPDELRKGMNNKKFSSGDRIPVIVTMPVDSKTQDIGVQFWTTKQIKQGYSVIDSEKFEFVEKY